MFNPELANTLKGAVILDRRRIGDTWVWFCDKGYGVQPYVTWVSGHNSADHPEWGHYHSRFVSAYEDFCERIRNQWEYVQS
jgi:hypothetical protein